MIDWLNRLDTQLFLFLNNLSAPWLDPVMVYLSKGQLITAVIAIVFLVYGFIKLKKIVFIALAFLLLAVGTSDFISSSLFKPSFQRLRPCKQNELRPLMQTAGEKCWGGKYGFISSHASNTFSAALFIFLLFRKYNRGFALLFVYAGMVSYSRIYLGKHFPGDLMIGALVGLLSAWWYFKLYQLTLNKLKLN